jgi:urease accessory protein
MNATARLLEQRSVGHVQVRMEQHGIAVLSESGSAKCRLPRGSTEAILINTSGGLAGGDLVDIRAAAGARATLSLTSQTAERVYRTLGPPAQINVSLSAKQGATLLWMPQECIFFDDSALHRTLDVDLADDATFLAAEPIIFGRLEMGERVRQVTVVDHWDVRQNGKLVHAERLGLGPQWPQSKATLAGCQAAATILLVSPKAQGLVGRIQEVLGPHDGVSAWTGKLVARLLASDGFHLRKTLIQVLSVCVGRDRLPKSWSF